MKISLVDQPVQLAFHPSEGEILFIGLINGHVNGFKGETCIWNYKKIKGSIRVLKWISPGELWIVSSEGLLRVFHFDQQTCQMKLTKKLRGLHDEEPITGVCALEGAEIATGDDSGCIKIWNKETFKCTRTYRFNGDFIADMRYLPGKKMLFAVSGDGSLAVYNIKKDELVAQSDNFDDEYHTLEFVLGEKKLVCFSPSGFADVYLWDFWGKLTDRITTESNDDEEGGFSVDSVCKYNESTLIAGCSDGKIRTFTFPKGVYSKGIVENSSEMPVEGLAISADLLRVASISHENCVTVWGIDEILAEQDQCEQQQSLKSKQSSRKKAKKQQESNDFFADLL